MSWENVQTLQKINLKKIEENSQEPTHLKACEDVSFVVKEKYFMALRKKRNGT